MPTAMVVVILGIVQGLTEFLPVSSSGHLVLAQHLLGVSFPGVTFEVVVHFGTLLAIAIVFWGDIYLVVQVFLRGLLALITRKKLPFSSSERVAWRFAWLIIIGSIPTAAMGIFLEPIFDEVFGSVTVVGLMLLVTGTVLWRIESTRGIGGKGLGEMGLLDALFIGFAQGCAIMPGLSRSGSTIAGALFRGLDRDTAMRFSFLLALPAITGATIFKLEEILTAAAGPELDLLHYGLGMIVAAAAGVVAIRVLFRLLKGGRLYLFGYYCWIVGIGTLLLGVIFR